MKSELRFVEQYLQDVVFPELRTEETEKQIREILSGIKKASVQQNDQQTAKTVWCYETIHSIQANYLDSFANMKGGMFYEAWCLLERIEIAINSLSPHFVFDIGDPYKLIYIEKHIKQFQSLYPYKFFSSPAILYLEKKCSICGEVITIRKPCGHKKGEIYYGEMCVHEITKGRLLEISVVPNPVQKYSVLFISDKETGEQVDHYNYSLLEYTISGLRRPFDGWEIRRTKIRHPHLLFSHVSRNDPCPCEVK